MKRIINKLAVVIYLAMTALPLSIDRAAAAEKPTKPNLVIIHTDTATLVCRADMAEKIKAMQSQVQERFGERYT